jgi:hypothetical protein
MKYKQIIITKLLLLFHAPLLLSQRYYDRGKGDPDEMISSDHSVNIAIGIFVAIILLIYAFYNQFFKKKEERKEGIWIIAIGLIVLILVGWLFKTGLQSLFSN